MINIFISTDTFSFNLHITIIKLQIRMVNIRNDDIVDGNPKLTLGLIWTIILHFQVSLLYILRY